MYRKLKRNDWPPFLENREYASENPEIIFIRAFSYEEIPEILENFKQYCVQFFRNKEDFKFIKNKRIIINGSFLDFIMFDNRLSVIPTRIRYHLSILLSKFLKLKPKHITLIIKKMGH